MKTPAVICLVTFGLALCAWGVVDHYRAAHARELQAMQRQLAAEQMRQGLGKVTDHVDHMQAGLRKIQDASAKLEVIATLENALIRQQAELERAQQKAAYEADVRRQQAEYNAEYEKRLGIAN